eukprot:TRINITY_DN19987_c0_g1_i1.p1 TRINITY_DN19987_c0_g1~~TRINITY_DN19987_c0_g1_i1.p1  ORF type:complete len:170 (+),score=23.51 TRINITY_DN19987_c0_g1_i1:559-1068(+)
MATCRNVYITVASLKIVQLRKRVVLVDRRLNATTGGIISWFWGSTDEEQTEQTFLQQFDFYQAQDISLRKDEVRKHRKEMVDSDGNLVKILVVVQSFVADTSAADTFLIPVTFSVEELINFIARKFKLSDAFALVCGNYRVISNFSMTVLSLYEQHNCHQDKILYIGVY